jgi:hypothetical protein
MPRLPLLAALIALSVPSAIAADVQPEVKPAAASPAATAPAAKPDPTAAVVAEGRFTYRQRDLDALMLIAQRHAKNKLGRAEEERLRQALLQMLVAREPLLDAMAGLPTVFAGKTRDALVLDLLDYQGEPATAKDATAAPPAGAPPAAAAAPTTADNGPLLVRLPVLTLTRSLEGIGKRTLALGLALVFRDAAQAKALEAKAPVIQDAILGYVQRLPPAQFAEPDQVALKDGLIKTVIGKVPDFPVDGILIPQLDVSVPEAADKAAPAR